MPSIRLRWSRAIYSAGYIPPPYPSINRAIFTLGNYPTIADQQAVMGSRVAATASEDSRRIVFFHPDLGIGGAERLVIDAAVGLQELGHKVIIFTSHCDPRHCFEEARDGTFVVGMQERLVPRY